MALREQPYLPLYVQDFLTDEKLAECSAESTGVYIRLMCILHKNEEYGCILLKQKDKQNESNIANFALKLAKQMPYDVPTIERSLMELIEEKVLILEEDLLFQKRMRNDGIISDKRSKAGKKGANKKIASDFAKAKMQANTQTNAIAKLQANSENEVDIDINNNLEDIEGVIGGEEETFKDLYTLLEEGFGKTLNSIEYEEISTWEDNEVTRYAIKQAVLNGASGINYINTILDTYKKKKITTLEQAERDTELFKKNKERKNGKQNERVPEWIDKKVEAKEASLEEQEELRKKINEVIKREN